MRIFTEKTLKDYIEKHPASRTALQDWVEKVKRAEWHSFADIKATFNSVDAVGNGRYVFNIKGNDYRLIAINRLIAIIRLTPQFVYIRFIGTHAEYDKISDIQNI